LVIAINSFKELKKLLNTGIAGELTNQIIGEQGFKANAKTRLAR